MKLRLEGEKPHNPSKEELIGAIVSFFLQLPILIRKNKKNKEADDSDKA